MTSQKEINRVGPSFFPASSRPPSSDDQVRQFQVFACLSALATYEQSSSAPFDRRTLPQWSNIRPALVSTRRDWINEDKALGRRGENKAVMDHQHHSSSDGKMKDFGHDRALPNRTR